MLASSCWNCSPLSQVAWLTSCPQQDSVSHSTALIQQPQCQASLLVGQRHHPEQCELLLAEARKLEAYGANEVLLAQPLAACESRNASAQTIKGAAATHSV
jgi:hypothetical protein